MIYLLSNPNDINLLDDHSDLSMLGQPSSLGGLHYGDAFRCSPEITGESNVAERRTVRTCCRALWQ